MDDPIVELMLQVLREAEAEIRAHAAENNVDPADAAKLVMPELKKRWLQEGGNEKTVNNMCRLLLNRFVDN